MARSGQQRLGADKGAVAWRGRGRSGRPTGKASARPLATAWDSRPRARRSARRTGDGPGTLGHDLGNGRGELGHGTGRRPGQGDSATAGAAAGLLDHGRGRQARWAGQAAGYGQASDDDGDGNGELGGDDDGDGE
ncbi:uncharacterized protein LOC130137975 [Syzygium oleosum]|uniref:uncharacterized protein LOC130137975 n=1 Tax=Syzygium oleosum TaxID=219896 RepID=UPI0024B89BEF|nr:uncharacterized protein LOC130137975 [Syzygium oleosum]